VTFELAWRKTIDKDTQQAIMDELKEVAPHKCWLGIKWLSTYFNMRPEELRNIKEGDIDRKAGEIVIRHPKENKTKVVYLLPEDVKILQNFPKAIDPEIYFFRHASGERFGEKYFYKWWKRACKNLDVGGVDLYGGTRHSTVRALRKYRTPEEIRYASMHTTNKAFERYYVMGGDDLRAIYQDTQAGKEVAKELEVIDER
jgi:integrase